MVVYPLKCFLFWAIVSTLEINWIARRSQGHLNLNLSRARIVYFSQYYFHVHLCKFELMQNYLQGSGKIELEQFSDIQERLYIISTLTRIILVFYGRHSNAHKMLIKHFMCSLTFSSFLQSQVRAIFCWTGSSKQAMSTLCCKFYYQSEPGSHMLRWHSHKMVVLPPS